MRFILALAIAHISTATVAAEKPVRAATAEEMAMVAAAMKTQLKDPDSAKYDLVVVGTRAETKQLICGKVNAKNSYGGYPGFSWFIGLIAEYEGTAKRDVLILKVDSTDPAGGEAAAKMCEEELFSK